MDASVIIWGIVIVAIWVISVGAFSKAGKNRKKDEK